MIEGIPRISVRIITYKQEVLIKRAIDSLLVQKDYIYEICVSDDCSPDGTWDVLLEYAEANPGLFKLNRNERNLGIFENFEKSWEMPTGDLIYALAGDDEVGPGWFKSVVEFVMSNRIDYKNELICIYGDYRCIYQNGDQFTFHNSLVQNNVNTLRLALRGLIGNRGSCYSIGIMKRFKKVSQGRSHIAEDAIDRQLQFFTDKSFYIPQVANIYHTYIGVSAHMSDETMKERAMIRQYALNLLESWGAELSEKDKLHSLHCFPAYEKMLHKLSPRNIATWLYWSLRSYDKSLPIERSWFQHLSFAIRRRLPHNAPIIS